MRKDIHSALLSPSLIDVSGMPMREDNEIFGPLLQLIWVQDFNQAILEANNTAYGLSAGLLSDDANLYQIFYQHVKAGTINWNRPLTGASSLAPFGGVGNSGNNRPGAYYAADYCAYPVASLEAEKLELPSKFLPGLNDVLF
jgi:succinylglutamic semialdehyde dehydrogenase